MQSSRSESALGLAGRSGVGSAGVRLAPVSRPGPGGGAAAWQAEEKHTAGSHGGGVGIRLVDAAGRPRDSHDPFMAMRSPAATPSATRVDAEGMPVISILSPAGLRGNEGDMSALLRQRVVRTSTPDLAALAAPKGSSSPKNAKMRSGGKGKAAGAGMGTGSGLQRTVFVGHEARSSDIDSPPTVGARPRVTDFSTDGGMGGANQGARQSMEAPPAPELAALLGAGAGVGLGSSPSRGAAGRGGAHAAPPALSGAPPHLAHLSRDVAGANAALQAQLRGLDLLSTAFGQLIAEVSGSKGNLARLLTRVQQNYKLLFSNLADSLLTMQSQYHSALRGCVSDYKALQLKMDGKVAHLEQRVRLLSSVSVSKDAMIELQQSAANVLESEMAELKAHVVSGIKGAPLKVEQAGHAIIAQASLAQKARARGRERDRARQMSLGGALTDPQFGEAALGTAATPTAGASPAASPPSMSADSEAANFENSTSTDALEQLSLESRNLTYELAELIQNVEAQSEKSAAALAHLDTLLERGAQQVGVEALAKDAALNVAIAGTGSGISGTGGRDLLGSEGDAAARGAERLAMAVEVSPDGSAAAHAAQQSDPATAAQQGLLTPRRAASATPSLLSPMTPSTPAFGAASHSRNNTDGQGWSLTGLGSAAAAQSSTSPSFALGSRPSSGELRSSSRWQFLRHMTERAEVEQKWSSATQTEEAISGYFTVLHLEPLTRAQQMAAAANEAQLPLRFASSVPVVQPEAERDALEAQEEAKAATHSVGTDALASDGAAVAAAPPAPAAAPVPFQSLRAFPLRINGFVLPGPLRDFLAPVFGLVEADGSLREDEWGSGGGEEEQLGWAPATATARSVGLARQRDPGAPMPPPRHAHSDTGRSAYSAAATPATGRIDTARLTSATATHRRNGSDFISILGQTPPITPRTAATPTGGHGPLHLSRRDSLSVVAPLSLPLASVPGPAATHSTTLIGHVLDPRPMAEPAKEPSPLLFQPLGTERRQQQQHGPGHGHRSSVGSASQSPRTHRAGAHSVDQSPAARSDAPGFGFATAAPTPTAAGSGSAAVSFAASNPPPLIIPSRAQPFREPTTADQLNPARNADSGRFAVAARKDAGAVRDLPPSFLAQLGPPLSAQQVMDTIPALYALYAQGPAAGFSPAAGPSSGLMAELLVAHALERSGSVGRASEYLGALLGGLMALYQRSELVRHLCHWAGLVHANSSGGGGADGTDFSSAEGLDMYARAVGWLLGSRSVRADPATHAPFDYEGGALSGGGASGEAPTPALSFVATRTADLFAAEVLSPAAVQVAQVREVAQRCAAWVAANARTPHSQVPAQRQVNHIGLAALAMRAAREWRSHVRGVVALAGRKAAPMPIDWRADADISMEQWRSFLRGVNAPAADALLATQPHQAAAMLRAFAALNRSNAQGDMALVCAAVVPLLRQAGFLAIHMQHLM